MKESDVRKVFGAAVEGDSIKLGLSCWISIDDFLKVAGFEKCAPTKEAMLAFDGEVKGYKDLIEQGNFDGS